MGEECGSGRRGRECAVKCCFGSASLGRSASPSSPQLCRMICTHKPTVLSSRQEDASSPPKTRRNVADTFLLGGHLHTLRDGCYYYSA